jgi:hypothetical protein
LTWALGFTKIRIMKGYLRGLLRRVGVDLALLRASYVNAYQKIGQMRQKF